MGRFGKRDDLVVHPLEPFNAETGLQSLTVRHPHRCVLRSWSRRRARDRPRGLAPGVHGMVEPELSLSLETLREAFRERTVTATLQCAGNRRAGLVAIRDIPGEAPWGPGATGTATWTGVALGDVLALAGRSTTRPTWGSRERTSVRRQSPYSCSEARSRSIRPAIGGAARLGDERRAARTRTRRPASSGRAGLYRRAQRQVARARRAAPRAVARATTSTSSTGSCPRTEPRDRASGCRSAWWRSTPTSSPRATARPSRPAGRDARLCVRGRGPVRRTRRRLGRRRRELDPGRPAEDLGRWAWRQWRIMLDLAPGEHELPFAPGTPPRPPSPRTRPRSGTPRATSTTPVRGSAYARSQPEHPTAVNPPIEGSISGRWSG